METQTLSKRVLSPEDIQVGDQIALTHIHIQLVPDMIEVFLAGQTIEPIRMTAMPGDSGWPIKVLAVCLPFLMTETVTGSRCVIDTRRYEFVRVSDAYAKAGKPKPSQNSKRKGKAKHKGKGKRKRKNK